MAICPAAPAGRWCATARERTPIGWWRIAPGGVTLVAELRGHERQAAEELEPWKTHHEERKPLDASQAAITLAALQKRWDRLRAGLDLILQQRGSDMADLPGGASGLLVRDSKGKEADRLVTSIDPGVLSLVAESPKSLMCRKPVLPCSYRY